MCAHVDLAVSYISNKIVRLCSDLPLKIYKILTLIRVHFHVVVRAVRGNLVLFKLIKHDLVPSTKKTSPHTIAYIHSDHMTPSYRQNRGTNGYKWTYARFVYARSLSYPFSERKRMYIFIQWSVQSSEIGCIVGSRILRSVKYRPLRVWERSREREGGGKEKDRERGRERER